MIDSNWRVTLPPGTRRHPAGLTVGRPDANHAAARSGSQRQMICATDRKASEVAGRVPMITLVYRQRGVAVA
jgi:hypothetical protein